MGVFTMHIAPTQQPTRAGPGVKSVSGGVLDRDAGKL